MFKQDDSKITKHLDFILIDIICMYLAYAAGIWLRITTKQSVLNADITQGVLFYLIAYIAALLITDNFKDILRRGILQEIKYCALQVVLVTAVVAVELFVFHSTEAASRLVVGYTAVIYFALTFAARRAYKKILRSQRRLNRNCDSLILITNSSLLASSVAHLQTGDMLPYDLHGAVLTDKNAAGEVIDGVKIISDKDGIIDYICRQWVDEVFINLPEAEARELTELKSKISEMGVTVHETLFLSGDDNGANHTVSSLGDYTVLTSSVKTISARQAFFKRLLDIVGGLVGLLVTAVLTIFIAPAIYISSPGPVFYKQDRIGKNGRIFKMYKFRSMYPDADARKAEFMSQNRVSDGMMFKLDWDPRIIGNKELPDGTRKTGIGEFIRKTSIDEFPQFLNVLKGDMSLVGTRPPTLDEWEKYELRHRVRMAIKPGITGMWQISGRSEITDFEEVVRLDREYIANWSMDLDIKILFKTVAAVAMRKGSM